MKTDDNSKYIYVIGLIPVIWLAILIAPSLNGGLPQIIKDFPKVMENPFSFNFCDKTIVTLFVFIIAYILGIGIYISTKKNYRRREEHGSAKWGDAKRLNKKYKILYMNN